MVSGLTWEDGLDLVGGDKIIQLLKKRVPEMKKLILKVSTIICGIIFLAAASATAKAVELKISHFMPTKHVQHKVLSDWAKEVETASSGQLKFRIFPGGQLGKPTHQYDSAVKGLSDIAFGLHSYTAGRFPLTAVMRMPFFVPNAEVGSKVFWKVYEKYLMDEYKDTKILWLFCHGAGQVFTTKMQIKTLEDFKGMKMRSPGKIMSQVLRKFDAIPVGMPITQVYTGLERKLIDGVIAPWETMRPFRFYEKVKFATTADMYSMTFFVTMNIKKYNSLPVVLKKAIDDLSGERMAIKAGKAYDASDEPNKALALSKGVTNYTLPPAELVRWKEMSSVIVDEWVTDMEAGGLPGKEILEYTTSLLRQLGK